MSRLFCLLLLFVLGCHRATKSDDNPGQGPGQFASLEQDPIAEPTKASAKPEKKDPLLDPTNLKYAQTGMFQEYANGELRALIFRVVRIDSTTEMLVELPGSTAKPFYAKNYSIPNTVKPGGKCALAGYWHIGEILREDGKYVCATSVANPEGGGGGDGKNVHVHGYTTKNGTTVKGYSRRR